MPKNVFKNNLLELAAATLILLLFFFTVSITTIPINQSNKTNLEALVAKGTIFNPPPVSFVETTSEIFTEADIIENTDYTQKIVNFASGTSYAQKEAIAKKLGGKIEEVLNKGDSVLISVPEENLSQVEEILKDEEIVQNVETDFAVGILSSFDWGVGRIKADQVWEDSKGTGVKIAVVDTGIDYNHPDLVSRYLTGYDFVNEDTDPLDDNGHGTAVSAIASAAQNGVGLIGVAPEANILAAKVLGADGVGYISGVIRGIEWAVDNGASVINLSLGTTYDSIALHTAVDSAAASGVVVVAAAGNTYLGSMTYPAAYGSVIAVGATDSADNIAAFSAVGSEVVAPGVGITAAWLGGGTRVISGTSASSPHVAGVVAHMIGSGVKNIRSTLLETSLDLGSEGVDIFYGNGLVDTVAALGLGEEEDDLPPEVSFSNVSNGELLRNVGNKQIRVEATDDTGILKVDLIVNGEFVYSSAKKPYQWRWNLSKAGLGEYELTARAYDTAENITETTITVEVVDLTPKEIKDLQQAASEEGTTTSGESATFKGRSENSKQVSEPDIETVDGGTSIPGGERGKSGENKGKGNVRGTSSETITIEIPDWLWRLLKFIY